MKPPQETRWVPLILILVALFFAIAHVTGTPYVISQLTTTTLFELLILPGVLLFAPVLAIIPVVTFTTAYAVTFIVYWLIIRALYRRASSRP